MLRRPTRTESRDAAFTLVELLIVVVIIATISVAALPAISETFETMKANALAREIASDIRCTQMLAVKEGVNYRISFWPPGQAYAVRRWEDGDWALINHPITKLPWRPELDEHSRYAGLTLKTAQFGSSEYLYFDSTGAPGAGGYVSFTLGRTTRTVRVAPLSGRVTVE